MKMFCLFLACKILTAKAILSFGLIYYYYRIMFIFLPISATLGPMMIRLQYMVSFFLIFLTLLFNIKIRLLMISLIFFDYLLFLWSRLV